MGLAIESPTGIYTPSPEALRKIGVLHRFKEGGSEEVNPVNTITNKGILSGQTDKGTWEEQVHIGGTGPNRQEGSIYAPTGV